ncbi:heterokaryon incompatibility protein-domain-containing protein [Dactylonectria macrodidyma]|uniref:Heterokaryon incompatibility protein-domain-containing protein n=1 Tax=Dactylonectria macrodidyma TaxID=307937 RepID=A0A9P9DEE1_9HYPO|nr:heterokaryon incompatibility protein-domain-containing protein [Dactylonectria macrodidyma]
MPDGLASGRTRITTTAPLEQIKPLLALPVSRSPVPNIRDVIQIAPRETCPVCHNLDPDKSPIDRDISESRQSWAQGEYNIPTGTRVAKIDVKDSKDLIEAAKQGCLYCTAVRFAFGFVQPGWEEEEHSFMHIFLASGLPVVVRLIFGSWLAAVGLGRKEMLDLAVDMPEEEMTLTATITKDISRSGIDVEIYRPTLGFDDLTVGEQFVEHIGFAEEIPPHAADQECFQFIKENVEKRHPLLPDRVIWIEANNPSRIRLLEPNKVRAPYIALSYCWGPTSPETFLTNASTLNARKAGIRYEDLPPLFRDVVDCARLLKIQYIWIDRLCIIQGDAKDFSIQAPKMGDIYGRAALTIAAASANSEKDRIFSERDSRWRSQVVNLAMGTIGSVKLLARRRTPPVGQEQNGGNYGRVSTRAWIWQERLLSKRAIFFTPSALKFECRCHSVWEGYQKGLTGKSWSARLDNTTHLSWTMLVEDFMQRDITRSSDRLPAIESVMKRIQKSRGWTPLCGIWTDSLVEGLGWTASRQEPDGKVNGRMNPGHYAPSWSWASVDANIHYLSARGMGGLHQYDPLTYTLEVRGVDAPAGRLTVCGCLATFDLSCSVELDAVYQMMGEQKFKYTYELRHAFWSNPSYPFTPDVPLKPWDSSTKGLASTVIRVPYGEEPPQKSWNAKCVGVMLGKMRLRCELLVLGGSLREPDAWERIGILSGVPPSLLGDEKQVLAIV